MVDFRNFFKKGSRRTIIVVTLAIGRSLTTMKSWQNLFILETILYNFVLLFLLPFCFMIYNQHSFLFCFAYFCFLVLILGECLWFATNLKNVFVIFFLKWHRSLHKVHTKMSVIEGCLWVFYQDSHLMPVYILPLYI